MIATLPAPSTELRNTTAETALPTDREIARRVQAIRSEWSIKERVERRHEAAKRFDALLESLCEVECPAA